MLSASQVAEKWARNMQGAAQAITEGVNATQVNPMEAAAQQSQAYLAGIQNAVNSGKWQAGLRRGSLQSWKDAMVKKGIPRLSQGIDGGKGKLQAVMGSLLSHIQSGVASLPARGPAGTNVQRMVAFSQHMSQFKKS